MSEYSANAIQTVLPGETIVFTASPYPCARGFVRHRDETGDFLLSGWIPNRNRYRCRCMGQPSADYLVDFGANIALPETGTVGPISVAIALEGTTLPATTMTVTPAAVNEYQNVSRAANVSVWSGCCESISIRNTSTQPILVQNANIIISRPDLTVTY